MDYDGHGIMSLRASWSDTAFVICGFEVAGLRRCTYMLFGVLLVVHCIGAL